jgi:DASH complex subunit DAD3
MAETQDLHHSTASYQGGFEDEESLSPLEQEVLDEYARLLGNLNNVCCCTLLYYNLPTQFVSRPFQLSRA